MNDRPLHLSRRGFLARASIAAASGLLAAPYVRSQSKTAPEFHGAIIGHGEFRYRVDKQWSKADPEKVPVKDCHEMVQAGDGRLFLLTNHKQNNVLIYDAAGTLLGTWTLGLSAAHGLTLNREANGQEFLYITDNSGRVVKTTLDGQIMLELPHAAKCDAYTCLLYTSPSPRD